METVKVGMLGGGWITATHRTAYQKMTAEGYEVQIVAVADIREECLDKFPAETRKYGDYHELLDAEIGKVDYIDICLPAFLHAPAAIYAMDKGYNVLCEKPMTLSVDSAQAMLDARKRNNVKFMVTQSQRFNLWSGILRDYVKSGKLGAVKAGHFTRYGGTPLWSWNHWFLKKECSGGAIFDLHMHDVDNIVSIFGVPKAVCAAGKTCIEGSGIDIADMLYFYDGFHLTTGVDWSTPGQKYAAGAKSIIFERGYIYYGSFDGKDVFTVVHTDGTQEDLREQAKGESSAYFEMKCWLDYLTDKTDISLCPPEQSLEDVRIIAAENESIEKGGEKINL